MITLYLTDIPRRHQLPWSTVFPGEVFRLLGLLRETTEEEVRANYCYWTDPASAYTATSALHNALQQRLQGQPDSGSSFYIRYSMLFDGITIMRCVEIIYSWRPPFPVPVLGCSIPMCSDLHWSLCRTTLFTYMVFLVFSWSQEALSLWITKLFVFNLLNDNILATRRGVFHNHL